MIDVTKSVEEQAKQAFDMRNEVKLQARNMMKEVEIEKLEVKKKGLQIQKDRLDTAINNLNSDQKILFNLVYINLKGWNRYRIISEMHISKDTYYRLKKSIVYSAINSLNPDRALKEIEEMCSVKRGK